jgi:hypothetical protein
MKPHQMPQYPKNRRFEEKEQFKAGELAIPSQMVEGLPWNEHAMAR